jgi:hypothetical protein
MTQRSAMAMVGLLLSMVLHAAKAEVIDFRIVPGGNGQFLYGSTVYAETRLRYRDIGCHLTHPPGTFDASMDGVPEMVYLWDFENTCVDDVRTKVGYVLTERLDMGAHTLAARYSGADGFAPAQAEVVVEVIPEYRGSVPGGAGITGLGIDSQRSASICPAEQRQIDFAPAPIRGSLPRPMSFPEGVVNFSMTCYRNCGGWPECPGSFEYRAGASMQLLYPVDLPPDAAVWAYMRTDANALPAWRQLPAKIEGRKATFEVSSAIIPASTIGFHVLEGTVGIAVGSPAPAPEVQDMWWGGQDENGWGLSIAQSGDHLFVTFLVYDEQGQPAFYVMREGYWDSTRATFSGALFRPNGRTMGSAVGQASITFSDAGNATLRYALGADEGVKSLQRMPFAPAPSQPDSRAGVWDLTNAGTGAMTISTRGNALFLAWLEFPDGGPGRWMVAPAGQWMSPDTYAADLYRTTGSRWAGAEYDAARLGAQSVGSLKLRFMGNDDAEVIYTIDGVTQSSPLRRHAF